MTEQKIIEEMRKEVAKIHRFFLEDDDYEILDDYIADMLYNAGYRKERQGKWIQHGLSNPKCSLCGKYNIVKSNYCPNCGAKMKGAE